jgi:hypothetical protein
MTTQSGHWHTYHTRWAGLRAPLRPTSETVEKIVGLVGKRDRRILLLGVTPELAEAFTTVVAIDKSAAMIENIWPGNTPSKIASEGDWLALDASLGSFSAIIGDGSCNAVTYPVALRRLLEQVCDHLERHGRFACRIYERPDIIPPISSIVAEARQPAARNFHAFKWLLAMHIAEDTEPSVPVELILNTFNEHFPDRDRLAEQSGWPRADIDTIDAYRNSPAVYCFPNRTEILAMIPRGLVDEHFHPSGTYDLAECCPIFSCDRR